MFSSTPYFVDTLEVLAKKDGNPQFILNSGIQVTSEPGTDEERTRFEELALIEINLVEMCIGHFLGYSKKGVDRIDGRISKEQEYCPRCVRDRNNKSCPYYKPFRLFYIGLSIPELSS